MEAAAGVGCDAKAVRVARDPTKRHARLLLLVGPVQQVTLGAFADSWRGARAVHAGFLAERLAHVLRGLVGARFVAVVTGAEVRCRALPVHASRSADRRAYGAIAVLCIRVVGPVTWLALALVRSRAVRVTFLAVLVADRQTVEVIVGLVAGVARAHFGQYANAVLAVALAHRFADVRLLGRVARRLIAFVTFARVRLGAFPVHALIGTRRHADVVRLSVAYAASLLRFRHDEVLQAETREAGTNAGKQRNPWSGSNCEIHAKRASDRVRFARIGKV